MNELINYNDFIKIQLCVGTIVEAMLNPKARKPAYGLTIDFGEYGTKHSSAQITENYKCDDLIGTQVIAVMNFPTKHVAGIKSEVLVLAAIDENNGTILLQPSKNVVNGSKIA